MPFIRSSFVARVNKLIQMIDDIQHRVGVNFGSGFEFCKDFFVFVRGKKQTELRIGQIVGVGVDFYFMKPLLKHRNRTLQCIVMSNPTNSCVFMRNPTNRSYFLFVSTTAETEQDYHNIKD